MHSFHSACFQFCSVGVPDNAGVTNNVGGMDVVGVMDIVGVTRVVGVTMWELWELQEL